MTSEQLSTIAGVLLSLLFSYLPGLNEKFERLDRVAKRLVMLGLLLLSSGSVYALSCAGLLPRVSCDQEGLWGLVEAFIGAMIANQSAYLLSPRPQPQPAS